MSEDSEAPPLPAKEQLDDDVTSRDLSHDPAELIEEKVTWEEFTKNTTCHGIKYIFSRGPRKRRYDVM